MRIVLIGFMGAGKTVVGERLAARLGMPFADLDREVEGRAGLSVREIFAAAGEPAFRRLEQEALRAALEPPRVVVATGGGTFVHEGNAALIRSRAVSVWLNPAFATIVGRIGGLGKQDRPLFRDEAQALALYRERLPAYRRADLTVDVAPEEGVEEVAARIELMIGGRACAI